MRGLLQSANDQAAAMLVLAKVLKDKMCKEEKRDRFGDAGKVVKQPEMFYPKNRQEELTQWQGWRLGFRSWLFDAQEDYRTDLDNVEKRTTAIDFIDMTLEQHAGAERLHSILVGLLRGRTLKILRSVEEGNGLEAWRALNRQMAPRTRAMSIALLQAFLSHPPFNSEKTVTEQVLGLERLAEEYHSVAGEEISDNTKLSVLLQVVTPALRQHLQHMQLWGRRSSTMSAPLQAGIQPRSTERWTSRTSTSTMRQFRWRWIEWKAFPKGRARKVAKVRALEKMVKAKERAKVMENRKGRTLTATTRARTPRAMARTMERAYDACKLRGQRGHWSRECPVKSQGAEAPTAGSSVSGSGVSGGGQSSTAATSTARRIQIIDLDSEEEPDAEQAIKAVTAEEVYDMTYGDGDEEWKVCLRRDRGSPAYFGTLMWLGWQSARPMRMRSQNVLMVQQLWWASLQGRLRMCSIWAPSTQVLTIPFFDLETLSLQKSKSKHEALGGMVELWRMEFMRLTMMRTSTWAHNMKQLKVIRCLWWDKKGQFAEIEIDGEKFTENSSLKKLREGGALCEDGDFRGGQSRMWRKWRSKRVRPRGRRCGSGGWWGRLWGWVTWMVAAALNIYLTLHLMTWRLWRWKQKNRRMRMMALRLTMHLWPLRARTRSSTRTWVKMSTMNTAGNARETLLVWSATWRRGLGIYVVFEWASWYGVAKDAIWCTMKLAGSCRVRAWRKATCQMNGWRCTMVGATSLTRTTSVLRLRLRRRTQCQRWLTMGPQLKEEKAQWSRWKILLFAQRSQRLQHEDQLFQQQSHQRRVDQESGGKGRDPLPKESKDPHFEDEYDKAA